MSTIGSRIRNKRQELGLTVDELASKLGKNRATVYRYESDDIENFPISVITPLAEVLKTSPAYLMGWDTASDNFWTANFRARLSHELECTNFNDIVAAGGDPAYLNSVASGAFSLSFQDACSIADTLGLSLDEMVGIEEKKPAPTDGDGLSETAKMFIPLVDTLSDAQKQLLLAQLKAWTEQNRQQALVAQEADGEKA